MSYRAHLQACRTVCIGVCVCRGVGALPWWRGHRAKMSRESGKRAIWIIKRDGRARPPACKSNKMLPLAEPSRCNVAMKAGYPSRREALEPRYGESKSKPTLPNINPCDGSIDSLCLCVYLGMYLWVCAHEGGSMCVAHLICTETCVAISGCWRLHMHVLRSPYLAMGHSLMWCNHFIMVMEIGFNFLFSAAARWFTLTSAWRGKLTVTDSLLTAPHPAHKHRSYL